MWSFLMRKHATVPKSAVNKWIFAATCWGSGQAMPKIQKSVVFCVASGIHWLAREHDWRLLCLHWFVVSIDTAAGDVGITELERGIAQSEFVESWKISSLSCFQRTWRMGRCSMNFRVETKTINLCKMQKLRPNSQTFQIPIVALSWVDPLKVRLAPVLRYFQYSD